MIGPGLAGFLSSGMAGSSAATAATATTATTAAGGGMGLGGGIMAASPYLALAAMGVGGLMAGRGSRKAKRANESRYNQILALLKSQGSASKQRIAEQEGEARAGMKTGLLQRGLTGSSAYDAAMNASREREQRQHTEIDEAVSDRIAGVMERRTDVAGGNPLAGIAQLALGAGQYTANLDFQRKMLAMLQSSGSGDPRMGNLATMAKLFGGG